MEDESILTTFPSGQKSPTCPGCYVLAAKVCEQWPKNRTFEVSKLSTGNKNMAIVNLPPPHVPPLRNEGFFYKALLN